ncbi:MAG: hypothetical protein IPK60_17790 [Sandaracinaceae bacterium]|nr:hypothetical protein [Sandaracinaceae bacterium]
MRPVPISDSSAAIALRSKHLLVALLAGCAMSAVYACAAGTNVDGVRRDSGIDAAGLDSSSSTFDAQHASDVLSVVIDPMTATLTSVDGATPTQEFHAIGTRRDGTTTVLATGNWSIDTLALGNVHSALGTFSANGLIGGTATISFSDFGAGGVALNAVAQVTVALERTSMGPGATSSTAAHFALAARVVDATASANIVYPLDHAVMPQNVFPANVQWTRGAMNDEFRITLKKSHITVTAYVGYSTSTFGLNWLVDTAAWRAIAQTDTDEEMSIDVDRLVASSGSVVPTTPVHVKFARAALTGSIYYWNIAAGRIERIDDGAGEHSEFLPHPPVANDGARCVGCHSVSNSGRYMAGRLGGSDNIGAIFDLTTDLTADPAPTVWPTRVAPDSVHWWFSSWSPDDTRLIIEQNLRIGLLDPMTGMTIATTGTPLPISSTTHPNWSRDGNNIAVTANANAWGGENTTGDIALIPYLGPDMFGAMHVIHSGTSLPGGSADSYPSYAPDSTHIAFAHGSGSRSDNATSSLYYMKDDGSGTVRLDNACGGATTNNNYQPRFSPFTAGGYYWMSFLSKRSYGNTRVGTNVANLQQIWVAGISLTAADGADPSAVAYWLPGQDPHSRNIAAYWAPRPCRPDGDSCDVGSECCGGDCRPGPGGALVCAPPPEENCRIEGQTCSTDADCCESLTCFGHVCVRPPT